MQLKLITHPPFAFVRGLRVFRIIGIFVSGIGIFFVLLQSSWILDHVVGPLAVSLAWVVQGILSVLGEPVYQSGSCVASTAVSMEITPACTGLYQIAFLISAILSWPATAWKRWHGIAAGVITLLTLNIIRLLSIYFCALTFPAAIPFLHDLLWETLMILFVPLIWLSWAWYFSES